MNHQRISQIRTVWSVVRRAHADVTHEVRSAQQMLLERYGGAAQRYLLAAVRDPDVASELYQEFALKILQGDLRGANPERGRFRSYLKSILFRMVATHFRGKKGLPLQDDGLHESSAPVHDVEAQLDNEAAFSNGLRDELLSRAWAKLEKFQQDNNKPFFTLLRLRVDFPNMASTDLASQFSELLGKDVTPGNLRVMLHRAREVFADLLLKDVAATLDSPEHDELEHELIDLRLLTYCRSALARRFSVAAA